VGNILARLPPRVSYFLGLSFPVPSIPGSSRRSLAGSVWLLVKRLCGAVDEQPSPSSPRSRAECLLRGPTCCFPMSPRSAPSSAKSTRMTGITISSACPIGSFTRFCEPRAGNLRLGPLPRLRCSIRTPAASASPTAPARTWGRRRAPAGWPVDIRRSGQKSPLWWASSSAWPQAGPDMAKSPSSAVSFQVLGAEVRPPRRRHGNIETAHRVRRVLGIPPGRRGRGGSEGRNVIARPVSSARSYHTLRGGERVIKRGCMEVGSGE